MNMHFAVNDLLTDIQRLIAEHPELAGDETLRADTFEGETDLHNVLARLVDAVGEAEAMGEAIKARAAQLNERRSRYEAKHDALRGLIAKVMDRAGVAKVTLPEATLSTRFDPPGPVVTDPDALPDELVRTKIVRSPDMAAIKAAMQAGPVPGVALSNGKTVLTIRTK